MVNNQEKGIICLIVTLLLTILTYIGLYLSGYWGEHLIDYGMWTYKYLPEKYMFYGSIISGLIGYTYLYGEPEKDFNKYVALPSIILFIIMDLQAVFNLLDILIVHFK